MNEAELATITKSDNTDRSRESFDSSAEESTVKPESLSPVVSPSINPFLNGDNRASIVPAEVSHAEAHAECDLEKACQEGDLATMKRLVNSTNINQGALHHAASNNQWLACNYSIEQGADVNARIEPLNATPLLWACRNGHAYIVKLLIDHGADYNVVDTSGFSALHSAVHSSNVLMVTYILHLEVDVDKMDIGNRTPLHWAIVQGDHLSVEALVKAGASSNILDGEGTAPISLAVYTAKNEQIVRLLLEFGVDSSSGAVAELAAQQPLPLPWIHGCEQAGRLVNGQPLRNRFISTEIAKVATFIAPLVVIPFALNIPRMIGNSILLGIPSILLTSYIGKRGIEKFLIPYCWHGQRAIVQSTFFAGIFTSVFICIVLFWTTQMAPIMFTQNMLGTIYLFFSIIIITSSYVATMLMDPGKVEPKSLAKRLQSMNALMDRGLFDSVHVCLHTYVAIPARARYDIYLDRVICRFDHYCPWLYNSIGVRNHRAFVIFLITLGLAIPVVGYQYVKFTHQYGVTYYGLFLSVLTLLQSLWIYVLTIVQLMQIARAATSNEVSHYDQLWLFQTDPIRAYSSLPRDHPKAAEVLGDISSASSLLKHSHQGHDAHKHHDHKKWGLWYRLIGCSQVSDAWRSFRRTKRWNMADHGVSRNCLDFWIGGGNMFHPDGCMGSSDGIPVDYLKLEAPVSRHAVYEA